MSEADSKRKLADAAVEYQSDAVEIRQSRLPFLARYGVFSIFILLAIAIVWASVSQVDVVVASKGTIVTNTPPTVLKPLERTVIKEVHVRVGQIVEAGEALFTFDTTQSEAETQRLRDELSTLTAQYNRMQAEFNGAPYQIGDTPNSDEEWQMAIYNQRQHFYAERLNYYDQNLKQVQAKMETTRTNLNKQRERLETVHKIEDMFETLLEKNAAALKSVLEVSISRMEMEALVDQLDSSLVELEHQLSSVDAERSAYVEQWRNEVSLELVRVRRELLSTEAAYEKMKLVNESVTLKAPFRAMVHEIAAFSIGSAVREAEALVTLIPLDSGVELEAEVRPEDIGKIELGADVRIKLTAYPFQKYGTLDGKVTNISEDTLKRNAGNQEMSYYRIRVAVAGRLNHVPDNWRLIPGMECQAEIKVGRRRIIEYLVYPLIKSLDEAAREP